MAASKHSVRSGKTSGKASIGVKRLRKAKVAKGKAVLKSADKNVLRGGALVARFFDPYGVLSVDRVVKSFGMSKQQLAETIGVKPETVYRTSRAAAPKTQARTTEMLEILGRIADWAGGEKQAMAWYRAEPLAAFGGRTAESLVKEGRAAAVRDYLDHIATGGFT